MEIDPAALEIRDRYKLLIGGIVPRPIAVVSTVSVDGVTNVAPFSFFNGVGSDPPTLLFCPANDARGGEKDSLRNAKPAAEGGTGVFVVNVAAEAVIRQVVAAAEGLPPEQSEFDLTGLTPVPSARVAAPRVAESPLSFECETLQVLRTNPGAPAAGNVVLGRVVHIHAAEGLVDERYRVDPERLAAVGRMGGFDYCLTRGRFSLRPGRAALEETGPPFEVGP
jgi:flavin reductase (DIM6/NTAB) family NADH-FMN oxidoreductase RutF